MEWVVALVLLAALVFVFGDVMLMLAIRLGTFLLMLWIVCLIQKSVASVLVDSGLIAHIAVANLLGFVAIAFLCCSLLQWSSGVVSAPGATDSQIVGIDSFRVGLLVAMAVAIFLTLTAVAAGKLLLISWIWLMILAVFAAGLDVCFPSMLGGAIDMVSPKVSSKGVIENDT